MAWLVPHLVVRLVPMGLRAAEKQLQLNPIDAYSRPADILSKMSIIGLVVTNYPSKYSSLLFAVYLRRCILASYRVMSLVCLVFLCGGGRTLSPDPPYVLNRFHLSPFTKGESIKVKGER